MLKFEKGDCFWSKTESPMLYEHYVEAFYFNSYFNQICCLSKNFISGQRCAIFYKL